MSSNDVVSLVGAVLGALGLFFGVGQYVRSQRVQRRFQEQMRLFINRANYVSWDQRAIEHFVETHNDPNLERWLWLNHQAGCDLYMNLVDAYLSRVRVHLQSVEACRPHPARWGRLAGALLDQPVGAEARESGHTGPGDWHA